MRFALAILLLLAGCHARGGDDATNDAFAASGNDLLGNLATLPSLDDPARLQALIDRAMPAAIENAKDAQYRNLRAGAGGSVCGEVAPKPAKGPPVFVPFVISPEALAVVGTSPKIAFSDPNDFLADAYVRWCATPEELKRLEPELNRAAAQSATTSVPAPDDAGTVTAETLPLPPPPAAEHPAPEPPAKPRKPPPPAQIDSFFNSVQHD